MRSQVTWPDSVSGWCFWASLVAFVIVVGVTLVGAAAGMARVGGVADILLLIVQIGFAAVAALFLAGAVCSLINGRRGDRGGGWRP